MTDLTRRQMFALATIPLAANLPAVPEIKWNQYEVIENANGKPIFISKVFIRNMAEIYNIDLRWLVPRIYGDAYGFVNTYEPYPGRDIRVDLKTNDPRDNWVWFMSERTNSKGERYISAWRQIQLDA